jgi:cell division protein FtsB
MSRFLNLSIALLSILLLTLLYSLLFGSNSYQEKALLIEQNNAQSIKNDQLKKENDILAFEIQNAQNSDEHIENLAREKLGLSYPDEEFITIKNLENIKDD